MSGLIKILMIGNHPFVRRRLASILVARNGMQVVSEAADGNEAIGKACHLHPDVILMDLSVHCVGVIDAIRAIRFFEPAAAIVVMAGFEDESQVSEAIQVGALGYLRKDTSPDELFQAIRKVANDDAYLPQEIVDLIVRNKTTVRGHVSRLLGKLGVNSQSQAARFAVDFSDIVMS